MHEIEDFKTNKQSDISGYLLFFMVMSLYIIYLMVNLEFVIKCEVLSICPKIYLQLFYYEHKLFEQIFSPLSIGPCPCIGAWRDNKLLQMKQRFKKLDGYPNVSYIDQFD